MKIITRKHIAHEPGTNINRVDMDSDKALFMNCMWLKKKQTLFYYDVWKLDVLLSRCMKCEGVGLF